MSEQPGRERDAPVGGQAVLEGVMMRGVSTWSVAVRAPAGRRDRRRVAIPVVSWTRRSRALRWPVIRGVVALGQSLSIGFKALEVSANAQAGRTRSRSRTACGPATIVAALALAVGLFFVVPVVLTSLIKGWLGSALLFWLVEGVLRTAIFLGYLALLSRQSDLRRLFEYHGAEHKVISCYEAGLPLDARERAALLAPASALRHELPARGDDRRDLRLRPDRAAGLVHPARHPRHRRAADRRASRSSSSSSPGATARRAWVQLIIWPGMQLQKLTTREPDDEQLEVAIAALEAVLAVEDPRAAPPRTWSGWKSSPRASRSDLGSSMIESLVEQIEARFAERRRRWATPR